MQGHLKPQKGRVKIGKTVKFAFLSQKLEELNELGDSLVREVLSRYKSRYVIDGKEVSPATLLEQLGFEKAYLKAPVNTLSGGQKRRLQLMLILLDAPNVLILDEPSNDLDTDMLVAMENVLDTWPGTLILVTHDRYLMERVTDHQFALIEGALRHVPRGVDEYLELLAQSKHAAGGTVALSGARAVGGVVSAASAAVGGSGVKAAGRGSVNTGSNRSGGIASESTNTTANAYQVRKQLASLERKMKTLANKIEAAKEEQLQVDPSDYVELGRIQASIHDLEQQKSALEDEWLELSERIG